MNIWEIRRLCRYLRCAADNQKIADFQRERAATVIEALLDQVEGLWKDNQRIAGEVMKIQRTGGVWNNGSDAGVFNSALINPRSYVNWSIGGRVAYFKKR